MEVVNVFAIITEFRLWPNIYIEEEEDLRSITDTKKNKDLFAIFEFTEFSANTTTDKGI